MTKSAKTKNRSSIKEDHGGPIFKIDSSDTTTYPNGDTLPRIIITEPIFESEGNIVEACYKLGDMYKRGTGCKPNASAAYQWYLRASELATNGEIPAVLGSIALRLAECLEEGFGCEQNFSCALQMYKNAISALEVAVDNGDTWYEKPLANARSGEKRCFQELGI